MMNEYDLDDARSRFTRATKPNRLALVMVVDNLREWADENSDGWAYWQKPRRAAEKAVALIESRTYEENEEQERTDITDEEMLAAVRPIKAFLTRQKVSAERRELILRATETRWFINEDGDVYDYPTRKQEHEFPNDDHTPYGTEAEAREAALPEPGRNPAEVIREIRGTIETADGKVTGFRIFQDGGWQQGYVELASIKHNDQQALGTRVDALEAIARVLNEDNLIETSDDDWDEQ